LATQITWVEIPGHTDHVARNTWPHRSRGYRNTWPHRSSG